MIGVHQRSWLCGRLVEDWKEAQAKLRTRSAGSLLVATARQSKLLTFLAIRKAHEMMQGLQRAVLIKKITPLFSQFSVSDASTS